MDELTLKARTKDFALRSIRLSRALPASIDGRIVAGQSIRAASSVGANYRAACRAKSRADFAHKLGIVEEEPDECCFWLELTVEARLMSEKRVGPLLGEANELVAIITASRVSVQRNGAREVQRLGRSKIENQKSKIEST